MMQATVQMLWAQVELAGKHHQGGLCTALMCEPCPALRTALAAMMTGSCLDTAPQHTAMTQALMPRTPCRRETHRASAP